MNWKYLVAWIPGIPIAIVNALLRESFYRQFLSELHAHQLSAASFIVLFGIYVWFILNWLKLPSMQHAFRLGLTWFALTVIFEFLFGHYVMGHPWSRLLHDYNVLAGRVWILVLIWITMAPMILCKVRSQDANDAGVGPQQ
jgi:hypothetical protein